MNGQVINKRAEFAFNEVVKGKELGEKHAKEYKSYVKKLPMLIKTNGLGSAMAFYYSRNKSKAYDLIYKQVGEWLQHKNYIGKEHTDLIKSIVTQDSDKYKVITNEVMALLEWMRRFAEGMIDGEVGEKDG